MEHKRSKGCGRLNAGDIGQEVYLYGWVQRRRDHGSLIFVDLRDSTGIVQVTFSPRHLVDKFIQAEKIRNEFVLGIRGTVQKRPLEAVNREMATGEVEVEIKDFSILNHAQPLPFPIEDNIDTREEIRLRYRYLDLRRPQMLERLRFRHLVNKSIRDYLDKQGFLEVETPILTRSTPEGARDFLVPSREMPGNFYALPQSPQLFKQILMVGGIEKYYQLARCFRDEDLRADRQPEFTQLDIEMSFVDEEDIYSLVEGMMTVIFNTMGVPIGTPFPRLTYSEAIANYGTDKPNISFGMKIKDLSEVFTGTNFRIFSKVLAGGGAIKGLNFKAGSAHLSRSQIKVLEEEVKKIGGSGLVWIAFTEDSFQSPIKKFLSVEEIEVLIELLQVEKGDILLLVADVADTAAGCLGHLRLYLAHEYNLSRDGFHFLWVTDFPLLEFSEEEERFVSEHHPFTMPLIEDLPLLEKEPNRVRARAYDLVLNGVELGGGSIRIHNPKLQKKIFEVLQLGPEEVEDKFGFLLNAFMYGTPPHGGIAFGLDRLIMLLVGAGTIREVIPFPKTQKGSCLMTGAPGMVYERQLNDLKLNLKEK